MSGKLRVLKDRIKSISSTKKITRAMEMVAASKLKKYQGMVIDGAPYADGLLSLLQRIVSAGAEGVSHELLEDRPEKRKALVLFTSDTGLCGSFNEELISTASKFCAAEEEQPLLIGFGKNGVNALIREGYTFEKTFIDTKASELEDKIIEFKELLVDLFVSGKADSIYVIYSHFISASKYKVSTEKLLPFKVDVSNENESSSEEKYIMEPDAQTLFKRLIPAVFSVKTRSVFLESYVSEQMARMNAMHQATENASELIDSLVLERNKARQAAITKELIEIVSGSQALKK